MRSCFLFVYSGLLLTSGATGLTYLGAPGASNSLQLGVDFTGVFGSGLVTRKPTCSLFILPVSTRARHVVRLVCERRLTTPALSITGKTFAGFDGVELQKGNGSGGNAAAFDEIRIGTTLGDVTAVPEPSTWLYFSVAGVLGVVIRHRRLRVRSAARNLNFL